MKLTDISRNHCYAILFAVTFLIYGNTLNHDFALDDAIAITENSFVKEGISGIPNLLENESMVGFYGTQKNLVSGGRYRPLSYLVFAITYEFFGDNSSAFHFLSVLFYGLSILLLFKLLMLLFQDRLEEKQRLLFAFIASLLFLIHPIHTEVVANIKGLDETLALICLLGSWIALLYYFDRHKIGYLFLMIILFFLSLLSKETAITFLVILPLSGYFFRKNNAVQIGLVSFILLAISISWYMIRGNIVGGFTINSVADNLMNDPFLEATNSEKYATIFYTLWKYIELLFFPHPLTFDYYPKHIPLVEFKHPTVILSIISYLLLVITAIIGFFKRDIYAFGIIVYLAALSISSNLVFSIGVFMNERFLFLPSLGFCIIVSYFLIIDLKKQFKSALQYQQLVSVFLLVTFGLFGFKTIDRNKDWKNNLTLATTDAKTSLNGAKSQTMAGGLLLEEALKQQNIAERNRLIDASIKHLKRAVTIYPSYIDPKLLLGNAYWELTKKAEPALSEYFKILAINPNHGDANNNIQIVINQLKNPQEQINQYERYLPYAQNTGIIHLKMGNIYGQKLNDMPNAILSLQKAQQLLPNNIDVLMNLSTAYALSRQFDKSIQLLERTIGQFPNNAQLWINLGLAYTEVGTIEAAKAAFDRAVLINPKLNRGQFPN